MVVKLLMLTIESFVAICKMACMIASMTPQTGRVPHFPGPSVSDFGSCHSYGAVI